MPKHAPAKFDPTAGSTIDVGVEDAFVPDATHHVKELASVAMLTPMGDPFDDTCIWGAPIIFWGLPSTAKSQMTKQAALEANLAIAPLFAGQRQPEDFSGVLMPGINGLGPMLECILGAVRYINSRGRGVIFLDELGDATPITQGALLGFIQDRVCGDTPMVPGTRILAAANPPKWSTSGFTMKSTTANRMCHFQVKCPPYKKWIERMTSRGTSVKFDTVSKEDVVRNKWAAAFSWAIGLFTGYMDSRGGLTLHQEPQPDHPQAGFCWASPRTWELAALMYATATCLDYDDVIKSLIVEGCVGEGCATDFFAWVRTASIPSPEHVLEYGWEPDPLRLDIAFAVMTAITQYLINIRDKNVALEQAVGAWRLYGKFVEANMGDLTVTSARTLVNKNLSRSNSAKIRDVADPVVRWMADNNILKYVDT